MPQTNVLRTPLRHGGSRVATLDEIRERREAANDRALGILKTLVCAGTLPNRTSVAAVEALVESGFEDLGQYEGYLLSEAGEFLEPKVPFCCTHVTRARGCHHSAGCPCGGDPCEEQAVAMIEGEFPVCEKHR